MVAIKSREPSFNSKHEITLEEFKRWLLQFDADNDGQISQKELEEAIRANGGWFAKWKSGRALKSADANHDGFINSSEIKNLQEFAEKQFGFKITAK